MKPKKTLSKAQCQRLHARLRFLQRKGIDFTRKLNREVVQMILDHDEHARFVTRQSNRVSLWDVEVSGAQCRVVYDSKRRNIVTVLPSTLHRNTGQE